MLTGLSLLSFGSFEPHADRENSISTERITENKVKQRFEQSIFVAPWFM